MAKEPTKVKKAGGTGNFYEPRRRKRKVTRQGTGKFSKPKAGKKQYRGQGR